MFNFKIKKLASAIALLAMFIGTTVYAQTTYDNYNIPPMKLRVRISSSQTTGIQMNPPKRNGVDLLIPRMSGAILEFVQGSRTEHIYSSFLFTDAATKRITMSGTVIRDIPWDEATSFVGGSDAQIFTPGAEVTHVVDARALNLVMHLDRLSTTNGSGALACGSSTQPCIFPGSYTQSEIDAFTFTNSNGFHILHNSDDGVGKYFNPTTLAYDLLGGSGSTVNATESAAGKVQLTTTGATFATTATGSTGASNVLHVKYTFSSGGTLVKSGYIPVSSGSFLHASALGVDCDDEGGLKVLTDNQTCVDPNTLVDTGSGANLVADDANIDTVISHTNATSYTPIDSTNLSESVHVENGSVMMFTFLGIFKRTADSMQDVEFNIQVDGSEIVGSGGILKIGDSDGISGAKAEYHTASFTYFYKNTSTATKVFRPSLKFGAVSGAGPNIQFKRPVIFQAIKLN